MTNAKFSFTYNKQLIAKLSEHFSELQRDEESAWQKISLALANFEDVEQQRWQDLRKYFKCSLVFQLSRQRFTDDQELIDRLQYPYLRKVYSVTISFVDKALRQERENRKDNVEDNTLFIKSVINGTYDPAVVAAYKRLGKKGTRIYVYINVNDPRYNLTADQRELLMQIERSRKRKKKTGRQLEAGTWHDVAVNVSPEPTTNGSTRKLLDEESLNINTQEYNQIIKDSLEPEISSSPKKRRFTVDSEVDSEEHEGIDISSASETSVVDLTSAEGDRPTDAEIIFVDPNNVLNANISINASRDPLQMSVRVTPCCEVPASGRIADDTTSEPLFTPSSGESVKTTTDQTTEPVQTAPEMPQAPIAKNQSSTCSEPKILRSSVRKRMRRLNRVPENLRSVLAKLIVSNCISDSDDSGDSDSDLSDALDVKKEPPDDEAISDNPRSMAKAAEDDSPTSPVIAGEARPASGNRPSADKSLVDNLSSDANSCIENADKSVSDPVIQIQAPASSDVAQMAKPSDESVQPQQVNSRAPAKPSSIVEANPVVRIASPSESQASIPDRLVEGSLCGEENSVADESPQTVEKMTDVSKATVPHQDRWAVHYRILNPILHNHLALYGTLRQRCPQLFQRTETDVFSDLNSLNGAITATLFAALTPTDIVRIIQVRAMVDTLAIRIAYGLTPQELERAQQVAKPNRPVLAKRNWEIVVASESVEDLVPAPKRLKISESGSSSFTLQSNSPVVICLSDSEDAPSLRLPVRKSRQYRVRQLR